jgi:DNA-binding response OmpR family regulator
MATMLLVADDAWVRNDVAAAVTDPGTTIVTTDDPETAPAMMAEHLCSIAIVDMQVGSMGGMAITRLLRDAMVGGSIDEAPIVMLLDRSADVFLAGRAGADAHLVKPFTSQQLRSILTALLPTGA